MIVYAHCYNAWVIAQRATERIIYGFDVCVYADCVVYIDAKLGIHPSLAGAAFAAIGRAPFCDVLHSTKQA